MTHAKSTLAHVPSVLCDITLLSAALLNTEGENAGLNQEMLDDVTTFYPGEDHRTPTPAQRVERSLELSDRAESGIYTATPSGISITHSSRRLNSTTSSALLGTQSSGRLSMPSHRTGSSSRSRTSKKRSSTEKPSVVVGDTINHRASTDFRAPDECPARSPLKFFDAVVKREPAPVKPVFATESNAGSDACLVDDHPRPIQETTSTGVNRDVDLSDSFSQLILSASGGYEGYDVEKDTTSEVCKLPSPKPSAPIDIPSRTDSFCTLPSVDSGDGAVEEMRVPPQQLLSKQISTDTTSTDSDSSDNNYIPLDVAPTRRWWTKAFNGLLDRCKMLASIPDSTENRSDCEVGRGDPKYVVGCGMRM